MKMKIGYLITTFASIIIIVGDHPLLKKDTYRLKLVHDLILKLVSYHR